MRPAVLAGAVCCRWAGTAASARAGCPGRRRQLAVERERAAAWETRGRDAGAGGADGGVD
ncbi:hypothetical protein OG756_33605 [Streptomyces sp. NBC_01310]|uniref:hypothetical protein n=1 Tax=Streptomyces sp. NBC_01310 TaxID=2903820 RepID=UPI0035B67841|nr:hypothetical protein OG756_33605 [Streptomyces sp. NBC_01310]